MRGVVITSYSIHYTKLYDAIEGKVIVNPDEFEIKKYSLKIQKYKKEQENLDKLKGKKAIRNNFV